MKSMCTVVLVTLLGISSLMAADQAPVPSEQVRKDLHGQSVTFTKPFGFFKVGDSMRLLGSNEIQRVRIKGIKSEGTTTKLEIAFQFVGMKIGENKQFLKGAGIAVYKKGGNRFEFVEFNSTSAGEIVPAPK